MNFQASEQPSPDNQQNSEETSSKVLDELINLLMEPEPTEVTALASQSDTDIVNSQFNSSPLNSVVSDGELELAPSQESLERSEALKPKTSKSGAPEAEILVTIEAESEPTLSEAVAYKAFLRQTIDSESASLDSLSIDSLGKLAELDTEEASLDDLAEAVNSLIPLLIDLLQFKLDDSREGILQTVRPAIDQIIEQRISEDRQKMALALAKVLPTAITEEIKLDPTAIAKAIAPEIALSIQEQIRLDEDAIPRTLGPEMGKAIKTQIELERDAMVDALYPVIGSTISKYMVEVVQDINEKIDQALSPGGIKRKFQARMQGISEAELILKESIGCRVQAVFLIHKDSGLVIESIQVSGTRLLDGDMLAGMLTAIRSFANDCISSGSELDSIDYGGWQIPLEVAGYCYLAAIVAGEPSRAFTSKLRKVLSEIVLQYDEVIEEFAGDASSLPEGIKTELEKLLDSTPSSASPSAATELETKSDKARPILLWLLVAVFSLVLLPWGLISYRANLNNNLEQAVVKQLDEAPELSVYRLDPKVENGTLTVQGRVPSDYLLQQATEISRAIAKQNNLNLDNQIVSVQVPLDPTAVTGEITRLTNLFNLQPEVFIATNYRPKTLEVRGFIAQESSRQKISQAFSKIPGVEQIIFQVFNRLPPIKQRLYFHYGSSKVNFADNFSKIDAVKQVMVQHPQLHLKIIIHGSDEGDEQINQRLREARCRNVKSTLVKRGVTSERLIVDCTTPVTPPFELDQKQNWFGRYVSFEPFIPSNPNN